MKKDVSGSIERAVKDFLRIEYGAEPGANLSAVRFTGPRPPRHASSFPDEETAEALIDSVICLEQTVIFQWLESQSSWLALDGSFGRPTGMSADGERIEEVTGVRVVLAKASDMPDGFRVHTSYPQRPRRPSIDLPAFRHFAGAYFHQDWDEDYGSYPQALAAFLRESPDLAAPLLHEVAVVRSLSEAALDQLLFELGCEFTLMGGETWHEWLDDLERRLLAGTTPTLR